MSLADQLRLAVVGGRVDRLRFTVTALGAALTALILLVAAVVVAIPPGRRYAVDVLNDPGLLGGVAFALVLLSMPALVLTALGARVGSPQRDRRLAALRLAGMTPAETRRVVTLETALAALAGSTAGGVVFLVLRVALDTPGTYRSVDYGPSGPVVVSRPTTGPGLPVDVAPNLWTALGALLLVPVGAVLLSRLALRRVSLTPFGVVRRERRRPPAVLPAAVLVAASAVFAAWPLVVRAIGRQGERGWWYWPPLVLGLAMVLGLLFGTAATAALLGGVLTRRARSVSLLLAARRMQADPWSASRATASVVLAVLVGAGAAAVTESANLARPDTAFFANTFDLIMVVVVVALVLGAAGLLVVQVEAVMMRRRTLATLTAAGVPRRVLVQTSVLEALLPVLPTVLLAAAAGTVVMRGFTGGGQVSVPVTAPDGKSGSSHLVDVPVAWPALGVVVGGACLAVLVASLVGLLALRGALRTRELRTAA